MHHVVQVLLSGDVISLEHLVDSLVASQGTHLGRTLQVAWNDQSSNCIYLCVVNTTIIPLPVDRDEKYHEHEIADSRIELQQIARLVCCHKLVFPFRKCRLMKKWVLGVNIREIYFG